MNEKRYTKNYKSDSLKPRNDRYSLPSTRYKTHGKVETISKNRSVELSPVNERTHTHTYTQHE